MNIVEFFSHERLRQISGKFGISYNGNGCLVARHNFTFSYDVFGRMQKISSNGMTIAVLFYHDFTEDKITSIKTRLQMQIRYDYPEKEIIQYFYGSRAKPFQISAIFSTRHGWTKFYYDDNDRIFAMSQRDANASSLNERLYYIITDLTGTPSHVLNSTGE